MNYLWSLNALNNKSKHNEQIKLKHQIFNCLSFAWVPLQEFQNLKMKGIIQHVGLLQTK